SANCSNGPGRTDPRRAPIALRTLTVPWRGFYGGRDTDISPSKNVPSLVDFLLAAGKTGFTVPVVPEIDHWMWVRTKRNRSGARQRNGILPDGSPSSCLRAFVAWHRRLRVFVAISTGIAR